MGIIELMCDSNWTMHPCKDAFAGQNAYNMPSGDVPAVISECDQRGCTAFVIFKNTAHLRSQSAAQCRNAMQDARNGAILFLKKEPATDAPMNNGHTEFMSQV